jgi:hypothetical protein
MKRLTVILSIFLIAGSIRAQEADTRSFVKQYSGKEGYSAVTINKTALRILLLVARADGKSKEETAFFSRINVMHVLSCPPEKDGVDAFEESFFGFCGTNGYESILESEDSGEVVQIYCTLRDSAITGFSIWNRKGNEVNIVFLNGRFTAEDMKKVMDKKGKNLL